MPVGVGTITPSKMLTLRSALQEIAVADFEQPLDSPSTSCIEIRVHASTHGASAAFDLRIHEGKDVILLHTAGSNLEEMGVEFSVGRGRWFQENWKASSNPAASGNSVPRGPCRFARR